MERVPTLHAAASARCSTSPTITSIATRASTRTPTPRATRSSARPTTTSRWSPTATRLRRAQAQRGDGARRHLRRRAATSTSRDGDAIVDRLRGIAIPLARRFASPGAHNVANVCAALASRVRARRAGPRRDSATRSRRSRGSPHRMALVARDRRRSLLRRLEGHQRRRLGHRRFAGSPSRRWSSSPADATRAAATGRSSTRSASKGARAGAHRRGGRSRSRDAVARRRAGRTRRVDGRSRRARRATRPGRATPCSSARRARASTCSATTRTAATPSSRAVHGARRVMSAPRAKRSKNRCAPVALRSCALPLDAKPNGARSIERPGRRRARGASSSRSSASAW